MTAAPDASYALLVWDDDSAQVRRFRSTRTVTSSAGLSGEGLAELGCSGSAQFSMAAWRDLRERLEVEPTELYVVDLRQESHGFLNEAAVSWYAERNWSCVGLSSEESRLLEALRLRVLEQSETIRIGHVDQIKRGAPPSFTEWHRPRVASEPQALGLSPEHYLRLPVTDHMGPSDGVVDQFVRFVRRLPKRAHLHFHCRGGRGRTSTFMALYDMLRNATRVPLDVIFERQHQLNDYDLRALPPPESYKAPLARARLTLLEQFGRYAQSNPGGQPLSWLEWQDAKSGSP